LVFCFRFCFSQNRFNLVFTSCLCKFRTNYEPCRKVNREGRSRRGNKISDLKKLDLNKIFKP
jgi:hypothetical protein